MAASLDARDLPASVKLRADTFTPRIELSKNTLKSSPHTASVPQIQIDEENNDESNEK